MNNIIKNYNNWLLESVDLINEDNDPSLSDFKFAIFAGSASNTPFSGNGFVFEGLQIPANKQFTFTLQNGKIGLQNLIGLDPAAFLAKLGTGKAVKFGTNTLNINGISINGTGNIIITGSEIQAKGLITTITASNNGILALLRVSKAMAACIEQYPNIGYGYNFACKFALGVSVNTSNQYEFWAANQLQINTSLNDFHQLITFIALRQLGKQSMVSTTSQAYYANDLGTKTIEQAISDYVTRQIATFVKYYKIITSKTPDLSGLISAVNTFMVKEQLATYFISSSVNVNKVYKFFDKAKPGLIKIYQAYGMAVSPTSATDLNLESTTANFWTGFFEKPEVLSNYIKALQSKFNNYIPQNFDSACARMTSSAQQVTGHTDSPAPTGTNQLTTKPFGGSETTKTATPTGATK